MATPAAAAPYTVLLDAMWSTVNDNFYDPAFHGVDWKALGIRYRAPLKDVHDDKAFEALASAMLKEIGTSHITIVPPSSSSASDAGIGVRFRTVAGAEIVSEAAALSDAHVRAGDKRGRAAQR